MRIRQDVRITIVGELADLRPGQGLGLISMRERARLVGGQVEITSRPGLNTTVLALVPLDKGTAETAS